MNLDDELDEVIEILRTSPAVSSKAEYAMRTGSAMLVSLKHELERVKFQKDRLQMIIDMLHEKEKERPWLSRIFS